MPRSKENIEKHNKRRRDYYAANKEEINKRRRQLYAEKKQLAKQVGLTSDTSIGNDSTTISTQLGVDGGTTLYGQNEASASANMTSVISHAIGNLNQPSTMNQAFVPNVDEPSSSQSIPPISGDITMNSHLIQTVISYLNHGKDVYNGDPRNLEQPSTMIEACVPNIEEASNSQPIPQVSGDININSRVIQNVISDLNHGKHVYNGDLSEYICSKLPIVDHRTIILPKVRVCQHCQAYKFYKETDRFCCSGGEVFLAGTILPQYLVTLLTGNDQRYKQFQNMIRTYNNHFAFTSIGATYEKLK